VAEVLLALAKYKAMPRVILIGVGFAPAFGHFGLLD
jgi:hypothetical protein